jgi:hypothetical protein
LSTSRRTPCRGGLVDPLPPKLKVIRNVGAGRWPEDPLTAHDLFARYRGLVARRTIEYWRYNKKGPPFIRIGRRVLYPLPGVIAWERRRTIHADLLKQLGVWEDQAAHCAQARGAREMVTDLDVYRTAQLLVRQHGIDAPIHASLRHDALLGQGDLDGSAVWKRVLTAIDALLLERPPVGTVLQ